MRILGIGLSHCAGVALIEDGRLVFAQEEDRFSRRRRHKGWPALSLAYLLDHFDLVEEDIDLCVLSDLQTAQKYNAPIRAKRVLTVHHHLAHILSGWALTPWADFDSVSIDGGGDFGSWQSFGRVRNRRLEFWESNCGSYLNGEKGVSRSWFKRSPAPTFGAYWSVPAVLNFGMLDKGGVGGYEGKLMGLAGHGDRARFKPKEAMYDGSFSVKRKGDLHWLTTHGYPKIGDNHYVITRDGQRLTLAQVRDLRKKKHEIISEYDLNNPRDLQFAADFASHLQSMTDKAIGDLFERNFSDKTPIVVSGGTFGNVVLNGKLNERYDLFVTPPMGDEGLALGAAAWGAYLTGAREVDIPGYYLGYNAGQNKDVDFDEVAQLLNSDKVIGLVEGAMELGPRALGARSILASPRDAAANLSINERLGRVEYMPFAPVILEEEADKVLKGWSKTHVSARHMTLVYPVQEEWRDCLRGVVHVDGTVRPQVLSRLDNPVYYDILEAFFRLTGIPVLINTSFNVHGEPIVRTIDQAIAALEAGRIDALVAGNQLHRRC
jgi:predicted NodU family carbamoyl transferase